MTIYVINLSFFLRKLVPDYFKNSNKEANILTNFFTDRRHHVIKFKNCRISYTLMDIDQFAMIFILN